MSQCLLTPKSTSNFVRGFDFLLRCETKTSARKNLRTNLFRQPRRICEAFGYSEESTVNLSGLMSDYYASAAKLRQLLNVAARICHQQSVASFSPRREDVIPEVEVREGALYVGGGDPYWYAHNPARLMETFWQCARHMATLSRPAERLMRANLHLVNAAFCSSDSSAFLCGDLQPPLQADMLCVKLRGRFLAGYLPEFGEIGI